ncbi:hypothetical protein CC1G_05853 [Coprinopsis cinerea okayama7|uniref:Uncharacterized protein n=1 Tax=Coprinopsis cinerea (strain Okayama-7 / 130 / ATCC MYA-4618 / FGSC 9003) TaxID=240176 RepID=A8NLL1_COPC7|nr:hypothetical protein CC1G_05853 [Coprinopsis cinerea okayama7\|eukprot:XP_001834716.2 hypothetical protein CC1G_05853 [Coprinopsis cinerea okayama7\
MSLESLDEEIKGNNLPKTNPPLPPTLLDGLAARGPILQVMVKRRVVQSYPLPCIQH